MGELEINTSAAWVFLDIVYDTEVDHLSMVGITPVMYEFILKFDNLHYPELVR